MSEAGTPDAALAAKQRVEHAMDARNSAAHFAGGMPAQEALRYLDAMRELRLACAQPGDQIAVFGEALQEIAAGSAHLYRDGDSYWFSPQPTLKNRNKEPIASFTALLVS